jgi:hypothetical protein
MTEFFSNYPYVKWILVGLGVLAVLSKYLDFNPINLLFGKKKYKFQEINHLNDALLQRLIQLSSDKKWDELAHELKKLKGSYLTFGFRALGQYADSKKIDEWIEEQPHLDLPKIIKSYSLVFKAWEVRGRGTVDTVSKKDMAKFKSMLAEAKDLLLHLNHRGSYQLNVNAHLLKIYKALDTDRNVIHQTYQNVVTLDPDHAELNFNYFAAISPKWGGNSDEVRAYLNHLESKSEFINYLITAQYYFDFVHMMNGEDKDGKMKTFLFEMKSVAIPSDELFRYELYLLLYWLSNNLEYRELESYYRDLVAPYCKD